MLSPIFEFFEKLIEQFTWKRLLLTFSILATIGLCLIIFESYTGHFKLSRIHNTIDVLQKSTSLPDYITEESKRELANIFKSVTEELEGFSDGSSTAFSLHPSVLKGLAAFAPWLFLMLLLFMSGTEGGREAAIGIVMLSVPFSIVGAILPDFSRSWINYLAYPILHCALLVAVVMLWHKRKSASQVVTSD